MNSLAPAVAVWCALVAAPRVEDPQELPYEEVLSCRPTAKPFFDRAWEALSNVHNDEARVLFAEAVAVDPTCTLAWAHLGALTPGLDGRRLIEQAIAGSAKITELERLQVRALEAQHRGDLEQALTLIRSALIYDPHSYRLNFAVANRAGALRQWSEMASAARRATELAPERGAAWNQLGYAYLGLQKHAQAIEALRRYAQVAPMEANAHDSLGDALLANDQLDEAKAAYQRALDSSKGTFWLAAQGVATVCALQGDWFCARDALDQARRVAVQAEDRLELMKWTAWSFLTDDQPGEAYRAVDELELEARQRGLEARVLDARLLRGRMLLTQRRFRDAMKVFTVLGPQKFPTLEEAQRRPFEGRRLAGLIEAQVRLGNVGQAEKALGKLEKLFEGRTRDIDGLDAVSHSRGLIALQRRELPNAIASFKKCSGTFDACRLHLAEAQELSGDVAAAQKTRALVRVSNHRDPEYWWVRTQAAESKPRGKQEDRSAF